MSSCSSHIVVLPRRSDLNTYFPWNHTALPLFPFQWTLPHGLSAFWHTFSHYGQQAYTSIRPTIMWVIFPLFNITVRVTLQTIETRLIFLNTLKILINYWTNAFPPNIMYSVATPSYPSPCPGFSFLIFFSTSTFVIFRSPFSKTLVIIPGLAFFSAFLSSLALSRSSKYFPSFPHFILLS